MKALVIGHGSMGRRRIRLLKQIEPDVQVACVDSNPERRKQADEDCCKCYDNLAEAIAETNPKIAFVCTSPGYHADIILQLIDAHIHVFTELNLIPDRYEEIISRSNETGIKVFMSSTFLYNRQIQKIQEFVSKAQKPLTYIYHVGQYLPDWHPWESYKDFFVGRKETNGVRELFAIQLPWIIETFGEVISVKSECTRCTELEIEFEDSVVALLRHKNGTIGTFTTDVTSRKPTTHLEIIGENLHLFWDGHNDDMFIYDYETRELKPILSYNETVHQEDYADNIIENQYVDEIKAFLDMIQHGTTPRYSLEKDVL